MPTPKSDGNRYFQHVCTDCGRNTPRDQLVVKQVVFLKMGRNGARLKSRHVGWLCPDCLKKDAAWQQPAQDAAPGRAQEIRYQKEHKNGA